MAYLRDTPNELTPGAWAGSDIAPEYMLPGGAKLVAASFIAPDGQVVTMHAAALAAATSISIEAITNPIPNGTVLNFGTNKFAVVNQVGGIPANASTQNVTVLAIPTALTGNETATYLGSGTKKVSISSGIFVGRSYTERDAGTGFGPADFDNDDEIYIVAFAKDDLSRDNDVDLILPNTHFVVYENFLPGWAAMDSGDKAYVREHWATTIAEQ